MDIAVIGAGGAVGREVAHLIVAQRTLSCDERLVLVGNPHGSSAKSLYGLAVDLIDAYAEVSPQIEVVLNPDEIRGDVIVMAGGATIPVDKQSKPVSRDMLADKNVSVFETYASALAAHGHGNEIVLCISNPNELAVAAFAKHLGRWRVIGMGAFLDSLRFRKEVATDLEIRRQLIHGFMVGEHGFNMVPLWSNVHVYGYNDQNLADALAKIRRGYTTARFADDVDEARGSLKNLIENGKVQEAYQVIDQYPPDIRVALKPFVTHFSGSKTILGTAHATMELIRTITLGNDTLISGQISVEGEFYDITSTIGVPFVIGNKGVERIINLAIDKDEKILLSRAASEIQNKIIQWL